MTSFPLSRRALFGTAAAGALAAPFVMSSSALAQSEPKADSMKSPAGRTNSFKIGSFGVTVISDGIRVAEKPHETFGTNQSPEAVADLLKANFLPTEKFVNGFSPTLIDTGTDIVLFDTGMGEGGREAGAGHLLEGLKAAGYTPDQVSVVVLTHMHGDHINGLMEGGAPAFKNARYVAGQVEFDFWKDEARVGTPAENGHKGVLKNVVPLADKMTFIGDGAEVVPGITGMAAFGHSPGHMVFKVESEGKGLVLTADTANHFVLSLQRPDWEVKFDMDKAKAAAARNTVFDMIATDRLPFVGYHMPFPAVGFIEKHEQGYRFVPETYQFEI
ncbi:MULTISPECIES: MBL fold metallo-hydrolase [unclassified Rhizobium]|uniref:MBL fold metallo-hydrolase n=1 Tax=unclassified Rhizobium TaxID=2613769 RepID=UPI000712FEDC|nr:MULTISPECIES: MBL fold metallo-hydrolase [unclassified Rhizobium]KQS91134.1 MBL fold metallo-hydrolase [Rhizobium sp. Leaf391]KQS96136.1 MBL fold metallo-hydrolase [Rhizobium sp. Leaf386]KQU09789.1 MBL fold metallo-hydrolase [Rhizobium sp. Leaf453]